MANSVALSTGVTLDYVEQGNRSGVPVLLLHGLSDSRRSYERVLPHLPNSLRAFALTLRGHGDSSKPDAGYATRDHVMDAVAFMDAFGLDTTVVVGHSAGSLVARRMAIDHPERTRGLVLIGTLAAPRDNAGVMEVREAVAALTDPVDPDFVREFQMSTLAQPVPQDFIETVVQESLKVPARVWRAAVEGLVNDDSSEELDAINAPTLVIWGDRDDMCPRSEQETLRAAIRDSRLVEYSGAGHGVHWEEPERLAADLVSFVETALRISES
jgi:non-heme chloroperoxidase